MLGEIIPRRGAAYRIIGAYEGGAKQRARELASQPSFPPTNKAVHRGAECRQSLARWRK